MLEDCDTAVHHFFQERQEGFYALLRVYDHDDERDVVTQAPSSALRTVWGAEPRYATEGRSPGQPVFRAR